MNQIHSVLSCKVVAVDVVVVLLLLYLIPSLSHLTSIPFYLMDPMRVMILGSYLYLQGHRNNALFLAVTLPLISFLISGHPVFPKNLLISVELVINVLLISYFTKKNWNIFLGVLLSIVFSKMVYYTGKWLFVMEGILKTNIVDTNILVQIVVALVLAFVYSKYYCDK